jgi:hypothetical protein
MSSSHQYPWTRDLAGVLPSFGAELYTKKQAETMYICAGDELEGK